MKTHLLRTSLLALVAAVGVHAQSSNFRVKVPFDFIAGSQTLPAGQYSVDQESFSGAMILKCLDHRGAAVVTGFPIQSAVSVQNEKKLVFHRYTNTYFLSQAWAGGDYGRQLRTTQLERELAAKRPSPEITTIAATH
jgi:hypothetical protein